MAAGTLEQTYAYATESTCALARDGAELRLSTSGGVADHPRLFAGELTAPAVQATALLVVGRCARSRFFLHGPRPTDPVVTCHADRLRFESLSACAGVYARHDTDLSGADGEVLRPGVTNVDLNEDTRMVLARIAAGSSLRLDVGDDGIEIATDAGASFERRVALPVRWVKAFSEVGMAQREMTLAIELTGVLAQRFLRKIPSGGTGLYAVPSAREPRWSATPTPGAIAVGGAQRLRLLEPLSRHALRLAVFGSANGTSCWQLDTPAGRTHLVLSPAPSRGFSGEGGTLTSLATEGLADTADQLALELAWQPTLDPQLLAARAGRPATDAAAALDVLAARGHTGFDLDTGAYFHRDLPFDLDRVEALHPRLVAARKLVADGRVDVRDGGREAWVTTDRSEHRVRLTDTPPACTCEWWARHRGSRGPCKHVLAAQLLLEGADE